MQKSTEPPPPQNATKNENVAACGGKQKTEIIELRDYQKDAIQQTRELLRNDIREILVQASTGAGKTIIGCEVMKSATEKGRRALFVAHRSEIVTQTSRKLDDFGISHGVIMANHKRINDEPVQVASIQTLIKRNYPAADVVIIDECHLSHGGSFKKLIKHYQENGAVIIGLTATPTRLDGKGLGDIYKSIVSVVSMRDLIKDGYLVETKVFAPYTPNLKGIGVRNGDYKAAELGELVNKANVIGDIVENWKKYALDRKTICFAATVCHSKNIVDQFTDAGILAKHLDANSSKNERDQVLGRFKQTTRKSHRILTNPLFYKG